MPPPNFPKICARCGSRRGRYFWKIEPQVEKIDSLTLITIWFGYLMFQRFTYSFLLPVCEPCNAALKKIKKFSVRIKFISAIIVIIFLGIYGHFFVKDESAPIIVSLLILLFPATPFGGLIGYVFGSIVGVIIKLCSNYYIYSFNGQYFRFKNKNFHRQFAIMNPTMVKK